MGDAQDRCLQETEQQEGLGGGVESRGTFRVKGGCC